ncbi:MAG: hypothetical protein EHM28_08045 [Spirochaetaceae bacterium]|nr:MAG: hypothetical protein EHM28_08045 [Spirochaetaceae bacterium]
MTKRLLFIVLLIVLFTGSLNAEEAAPAAPATGAEPGFTFAFGFALGYSAFSETETYQKLSLRPDFGFGKFGIGLAMDINYRFVDSELEVRSEDWVPDDEHSFFDLYLPMFRYIRYGKKHEPIFVKIGAVEDMTLGNGFIMNNYANTLFLPETRISGLEFDMDGALFGFPLLGFETVVGNLAALDVVGARFYVRPLVFIKDLPILPNLQIGVTYAMDQDPFMYVYDGWAATQGVADAGSAYADAFGIDLKLPILTEAPVTFAL